MRLVTLTKAPQTVVETPIQARRGDGGGQASVMCVCVYTVGYSVASTVNDAIAHVTQGSATIPRPIGKGTPCRDEWKERKATV